MEDGESIRSLLETAADLFDPEHGPANLETVAEAAGVSVSELQERFESAAGLVDGYFADLAARCAVTVDEIGPGTTEERFAAFCFIMLDLLEERPAAATGFPDIAGRWGSRFRAALGGELGKLLHGADVPALNQLALEFMPVRAMAVEGFVRLMQASLEDDSPDRARSAALMDKSARFYAEIATNQTVTRGVDLVKYAAEAGYVPFVASWFASTESGDQRTGDG